jgi:hypothetical protein
MEWVACSNSSIDRVANAGVSRTRAIRIQLGSYTEWSMICHHLQEVRTAKTYSSPSRSRSRDCGYALGDKLKEIITIRKDNQVKTIEFYVAWQPQ